MFLLLFYFLVFHFFYLKKNPLRTAKPHICGPQILHFLSPNSIAQLRTAISIFMDRKFCMPNQRTLENNCGPQISKLRSVIMPNRTLSTFLLLQTIPSPSTPPSLPPLTKSKIHPLPPLRPPSLPPFNYFNLLSSSTSLRSI
jgi:hypothetical protein